MPPLGRWAIAAAALAICLLTLAPHETEAAETVAIDGQAPGAGFGVFKLPKLFDFDYYKQKYGKTYKSLQESLARKAYFMARALRAYVSGMNFKWRRSPYFLAINHLSDSSPQEKERRRNKVLMEKRRGSNKSPAQVPDELPEFLPAQGENVEAELLRLAEANREKPGYRELLEAPNATRSRRKREVSKPQMPREFSLDQLMAPGVHEPARERAEVEAKITSDVPSNNPFYRQPEILTRGLSDNHEEVESKYLWDRPKRIASQLKSSLDGISQAVYLGQSGFDYGEDGMYFDHRDSNCLTMPRHQGVNCGSCYAFAAIAYMEWLYCTKKGKIIPFSEQYMIDCGKGRYGQDLDGCEGATDHSVAKFIQNFGMEREKTYPYVGFESECPYDEDQIDIKETGYIRMQLDNYAKIPIHRWEYYIEYSPIFLTLASPIDYDEYSGGVHDGHNCADEGDHAQLVVGHGREDGQDYWLMRNSYGPKWGEGGYFKLSKDAPKRCMEKGVVFGTEDGMEYITPSKNDKYKRILNESEMRAK